MLKNKFNRKIKRRRRSSNFFYVLAFFVLVIFYLSLRCIPALYQGKIINPLSYFNDKRTEEVALLLAKKKINYLSIKNNSDSFNVFLKDNSQIIISKNKELSLQIDSLQLILNRLTIEGKRFKSLDFRFDKPIISY